MADVSNILVSITPEMEETLIDVSQIVITEIIDSINEE